MKTRTSSAHIATQYCESVTIEMRECRRVGSRFLSALACSNLPTLYCYLFRGVRRAEKNEISRLLSACVVVLR
jgi:hypothetical protein